MAEEGEYVEDQTKPNGSSHKRSSNQNIDNQEQLEEDTNIDVWDDSALVDAYNTAVKKYMVTHICNTCSNESS